MNRENSPLKQADDAILLDSSTMTAKEVQERIMELFRQKKEKGEKQAWK